MIEPKNWKTLDYSTGPICPIISAQTVKQANKYIECLKENCMWWHKCKPLEATMENTERQHGEWIRCGGWSEGIGMGEYFGYTYKCSVCGQEVKGGYASCDIKFCLECGSDNRPKEGEIK